jgi:anti-sigma factor RsiW
MSCGGARRLFSARLDGRIGPDEARALDAHLAGCAACGLELSRWESAARALRAAGPTPVPPGLAQRAFLAATRPERRASGAFLPAARKVALAGAIAAAAVWVAALATGAAARGAAAEPGQDPVEVAVLLWTAEGGR